MISLFREPKQGEFIVIGADPAEGGDNSAFVAISKHSADVVMSGCSKEESPQLGYTLNYIGKWIKKKTEVEPCIAVERNVGSATIYVLKELNYPNLYRMPSSFTKTNEKITEQYGWVTSMATRPKMLDDLALAIRQRAIIIPDKRIVDEMYSFIRNPKTGKAEADLGCNDDLITSLAIAWQLYQTETSPADFDMAEWNRIQDEEKRERHERYGF